MEKRRPNQNIRTKNKEYYDNNKNKLLEQSKQHYYNNRSEILKYTYRRRRDNVLRDKERQYYKMQYQKKVKKDPSIYIIIII